MESCCSALETKKMPGEHDTDQVKWQKQILFILKFNFVATGLN